MPSAQKAGSAESVDAGALLATYRVWLARQSLATRSQEAYAAQVARFLTWLTSSEHGVRALSDPHVRDWAVRDYKRHVKTQARWAPSSVNQALAAIDNFYRSLGAGRADVPREDLPQLAPRALEETDQRRFLRAVEASPLARDRAIATLFFYTRCGSLSSPIWNSSTYR